MKIIDHHEICEVMEVPSCINIEFSAWLGDNFASVSDASVGVSVSIPMFKPEDKDTILNIVEIVFNMIYSHYRLKIPIKKLNIPMERILPGYPITYGKEQIVTDAIFCLVAQIQPNVTVTWK